MDLGKTASEDLAAVEAEMASIVSAEPKAVYGMLGEYLFRGGKRIRPALLMLVFRALGGRERETAVKTAALIELFHNFTLIHDDIEDDSKFRRGKPTLHISHGLPIALNSGDALYTLVWNWFLSLNIETEKKVRLASIAGCAFQKVVEGQGVELDWYRTSRTDVSEAEYFSMVEGKTGALMGASCRAGAYLAGADPALVEKFGKFGLALGVAFQIHDDVLNLVGDFEKYKKEIGGDITEGKRSLIFIHAMAHMNLEEKARVSSIIKSNSRNRRNVAYVISVFRKTGSIEYAKDCARRYVENASAFLKSIRPSPERDSLLSLSLHVVRREL